MDSVVKNPLRPAPPSSRAASNGKKWRLSVARVHALAFAVMAAVLIGAALVLHTLWSSQLRDLYQEHLRQLGGRLSHEIAARVQHDFAAMESLARDPSVAAVLTGDDRVRLQDMEAQLAYAFPESFRVRLLPTGITQVDETSAPPLGYAALAMLRDTEAGRGLPPAEVQLFGSPQQSVALSRPITGNLLISLGG